MELAEKQLARVIPSRVGFNCNAHSASRLRQQVQIYVKAPLARERMQLLLLLLLLNCCFCCCSMQASG